MLSDEDKAYVEMIRAPLEWQTRAPAIDKLLAIIDRLTAAEPAVAQGDEVAEIEKEFVRVAIAECERAVAQALRNDGSASPGQRWDTCFGALFKPLIERILKSRPAPLVDEEAFVLWLYANIDPDEGFHAMADTLLSAFPGILRPMPTEAAVVEEAASVWATGPAGVAKAILALIGGRG